eukprot:Sspe_Gene.7677::Locus_2599_Transcript_1_1_Confidence_1.000_Length_1915::g.7677::m.7677
MSEPMPLDGDVMVQPLDLPVDLDEDGKPCCGKNVREFMAGLYTVETPLFDGLTPPWRIYLVNKHIIVFVFDHVVGDGMSLVQAFFTFTDVSEDRATLSPQHSERKASIKPLPLALRAVDWAWTMGKGFVKGLVLPLHPHDSKNAMKIDRLFGKRIAEASKPYPLQKVKEIKDCLGCTVNDVVMAALSGAIREHLLKYSPDAVRGTVRGAFPLNLRGLNADMLKKPESFGNSFTLLPFWYSVGKETPLERLAEIQMDLNDLKHSPEYHILTAVNGLAQRVLPTGTYINMSLDMMSKLTSVATNVPGPSRKVSIQGSEIEDIEFYTRSPVTIVFHVFTFNNRMKLSILADEGVPDLPLLCEQFNKQLDALAEAAASTPSPTSVYESMKYKRAMTRVLWTLVLLVVIAALVFTCP